MIPLPGSKITTTEVVLILRRIGDRLVQQGNILRDCADAIESNFENLRAQNKIVKRFFLAAEAEVEQFESKKENQDGKI